MNPAERQAHLDEGAQVQEITERVRLLEMATVFAVGGTEKQLVELARNLDGARFDVQLACLRSLGALLKDLKTPPAEFRIDHLYGLRTVLQQLRFARHLRRNRIDVFHAQGFYANVFGIPAARLAGTPVVIASVRDLGDQRTRLQQIAQRFACGMADAVVVNADVVRRQLVDQGWSQEKIHVIPNGVDLARFSSGARPELLRELRLPGDGPLVAVVSRLTRSKGIEHFVDAAAAIAPRFPQARFLVVGDDQPDPDRPAGTYRKELEERARGLGLGERIVFAGARLDVPEILAHAQVAVIPSLSEALSNSLLESMAAGAAVVATDVGGNPEVVEDGVTGLLVPPSDPAALARAIGRLLEQPLEARRLGEAARHLIHGKYSVERMVRTTEQLYLGLLDRARAPRRGVAETSTATLRTGPRSTASRIVYSDPKGLDVALISDGAALAALGPTWDDLVERAQLDHPFLSHDWISTWWAAFAGTRQLRVLAVYAGERCIGIAPLMLGRTVRHRIPVRSLELIGNDHTPRSGFIVAERPDEVFRALLAAIEGLRDGWDVLVLSRLVAGSQTEEQLERLGRAAGMPVAPWRPTPAPYVALREDWDSYQKTLRPKVRSNTRNRIRRLEKLGKVELEEITGGELLGEAIEEGLRIEAAAWKGANGTAIVSHADTALFYRRLAERAAARGWLSLQFLKVGGRRIAFSYGLRLGRTHFLVKMGYDPDPAYAPASPSNVLCYLMIEDDFRRGACAVEFLGEDEPWKRDWANDARDAAWLHLFRPSLRGRSIHFAKSRLLPAVRRLRSRAP